MSEFARLLTTPVRGGDLQRIAKMGGGASMRSYQPSIRERMGNAIYDLFGGSAYGNRMRGNVQAMADFIPGVGDAVGAQEAGRDYQAGNYLGAGLGGLATAMGIIPGAGDMAGRAIKSAEEPIRQGIRAFHGSPHDFDKFSLDKIGTGEGAQAYGHGLYFAESEGVAKSYRDALAGTGIDGKDPVANAWDLIHRTGGNDPAMRAEIRQSFVDMAKDDDKYSDFARRSVEAIDSGAVDRFKPPGSMYEVNINANPDDFLDWDGPLPDALRTTAEKYLGEMAKYARTGGDLVRKVGSRDIVPDLQQFGIPGIKYLDAGSRGAGDGSRNYVVFDDSLIEIVRKYGIAAAIAGGLITREQADQMTEQGAI